jgi:DNA polymerase-3 subunit gamma/tau
MPSLQAATKSVAQAAAPQPPVPQPPIPQASAPQSKPQTSGALALAETPAPQILERPHLVAAPAPSLDLDALQEAAVAALGSVKGQQSASDKLADSTWSASADTLTIQTTVSAALIKMLFNADAERILQSTLAAHGVKLRLRLLPGEAPAEPMKKPRKAAATGSVQALAENHPIVQQARQLFSAEISNVIDLRDKDA